MDFKILAIFFLVGSAIFTGCASSPDTNAKKIGNGMTKADVIEIMGNPDHTDRAHNMDRWTYDAENGLTKAMEIYFAEGKVSFFGNKGDFDGSTRVVKAPQKGSFKEVPAEKGFKPVPEEKPAGK